MLSELQRLLVAALGHADPRAWLHEQLRRADHDLTPVERGQLLAIGDDGLRLTRVLVRKLRMQRLLHAVPELAQLAGRDPAAFAQRFTAYEAAVPPHATTSSDEAAAYTAFARRMRNIAPANE